MPVFNKAAYLRPALDSILDQTFADFELIAIDDGSSDGSGEILAERARGDRRVRLFRQENCGVSATRNRGLTLSRGVFVAMMDPDDLSTRPRLADQAAFLEAHPDHVVVGGDYIMICPAGVKIRHIQPPRSHDAIEQELLIGEGGALTQGASMFRRAAAIEAGGYDETIHYGEDLDFFLRMAELGRLANLPQVHLYYRQLMDGAVSVRGNEEREALGRALNRARARRGLQPLSPESLARFADRDRAETCVVWALNALLRSRLSLSISYFGQALRECTGSSPAHPARKALQASCHLARMVPRLAVRAARRLPRIRGR